MKELKNELSRLVLSIHKTKGWIDYLKRPDCKEEDVEEKIRRSEASLRVNEDRLKELRAAIREIQQIKE